MKNVLFIFIVFLLSVLGNNLFGQQTKGNYNEPFTVSAINSHSLPSTLTYTSSNDDKAPCDPSTCDAPIAFPLTGNGTQDCISECNDDAGAVAGPDFAGNNCYDFPNPTVWFEITTPVGAATLDVDLSSTFADPYYTVFETTDCANYTIHDCFQGSGGSAINTSNVPGGTTLLIAVSDVNGGVGDFTLCVTPDLDQSACNIADSLYAAATSMGSPLGGPYLPGEDVMFCYEINNYEQFNCNWFSGLVPSFGDCWDPSSFDAQGQPVVMDSALIAVGSFYAPDGAWNWWPAGSVEYNPGLGSTDWSDNEPLPGGWFFSEDGTIDPDQSWGDGNGMGTMGSCEGANSGLSWKVCFTLTTTLFCDQFIDCSVGMDTFADGEIGDWTNVGCVADGPVTLAGGILCCTLIPEAGVNDTLCLGSSVSLNGSYTGEDGATTVTWTSNPAGAVADLSDPNILTPTYTPSSSGTTTFYMSVTDQACTRVDSVFVTTYDVPDVDPLGNQEVCDTYTLPTITGTNLTGNQAYYTGSGGTGTIYNEGASFTTPGTTTLYIYDETGTNPNCFDEESFTVTINLTPTITNAVLTEEFCSGGTTGIVPTADVVGTTFDWTAVGSSGSVTGFSASGSGNIIETLTNTGTAVETVTYTVTPIGPGTPTCPGIPVDFVVTVNPVPTITNAVLTEEFCSGGTTGIVPAADVAGTTFTWTAVGSSGNVTGFSASGSGNISETLTNSGSAVETVTYTVTPIGPGTPTCPGTPVDFVVTVNPVPTITNAVLTEEFCSGGTTGIVPTSDVAGTTFTWTAVGSSGNVTGFSVSGSGNIIETLTNSGTAVETVTYTVTPIGPGTPTCPGIPVDFVVTVNPIPTLTVQDSTGCSPFLVNLTDPTYWSTDVGTLSYYTDAGLTSAVADPTNVGPGTYYIAADNLGCITSAPVVLTENQSPVIATSSLGPFTCNATDGSIEVTLTSGATSSGVLDWTGTATGSNNPADITADSPDITNLGAGSYDITFTDDNGCVSNTESIVLNNPGAPIIDPISAVVSCLDYTLDLASVTGTDLNLTGQLNYYTETGGPSGTGVVIPDGTTFTPFTNTTIYVYDENGACSAEIQYNVTINVTPTLTLQDSTTCSPNTVELSDVTYWSTDVGTMTWYSDAGLSLILPSTNVGAGTYYVEADNAGCTSDGQVTITVNTTPTLTIQDTTVCIGSIIDLTDATYWTTDVGAISYYEADGTTPIADPTNVGAGTYVIEANNLGCIATGNVIVSEFAPTVIDAVGTPPLACNGTDGSIEVTLTSGPTSVGTLDWIGTATGTNASADITVDSPDISSLAAGTYDVTFTDANGCISNTVNVVLANPFAPVIDPIANIVSCTDQTLDLSTVTGTDLVNPQYYTATGGPAGAGVVIPDGTTYTPFTNTTIFVYDENGSCTSEVSYTITINTTPTLTLQDSTTCSPNTVDLSDVTYWSADVGTLTWYSDAGLTTALGSTVVGDGTYYVEADNLGCTSNGQAIVTVNTTPTLTLQDSTTCSPNTVDLADATYWSTDVGTMTWYSDAGLTTVLGSTVVGDGTYYVEADNLGCTSNGQVTVTVNTTPTLTLQDTTDCSPFTVDLGDVTYWSTDVGTMTWYSDAGLTTVLPSTSVGAGTYYVEADNAGCTTSGSVVVTEVTTPDVDPLGPISECDSYTLPTIFGTSLSGTQAYYTGMGGTGTQFNTGDAITTVGLTTLYIYDGASGCSDEEVLDITITTTPTITVTTPAEVCEPNTVDISNAATSDVGTLTWYSDAALTTPLVDPTQVTTGTYYVGADNGGCTSSDMVNVTVNPLPPAPTAGTDSTYCTAWTLVDMTATGTGGILNWYLDTTSSSVATGGAYMPAMTEGTTSYFVTETLNGCEGPASTVVITIEVCDIFVPTAITPNGDLNNDNWEIVDLDAVYPDNTVRVFNRWGNMIFEHISTPGAPYDQNRWDGTYDGDALPVGSYYYVIELNDEEGNVETGSVSIILD